MKIMVGKGIYSVYVDQSPVDVVSWLAKDVLGKDRYGKPSFVSRLYLLSAYSTVDKPMAERVWKKWVADEDTEGITEIDFGVMQDWARKAWEGPDEIIT